MLGAKKHNAMPPTKVGVVGTTDNLAKARANTGEAKNNPNWKAPIPRPTANPQENNPLYHSA